MNRLCSKLSMLNLCLFCSLSFCERPVVPSDLDHEKETTANGRPVNSREKNLCSPTTFDKNHGTIELGAHQKSYQISKATYIFTSRPPVPESPPLPLIEIKQEGTTTKRYHATRGGVDYNNPIYTFNLRGWSYEAPQNGTFRTALAQGLECSLSEQEDFGKKLERILSDESLFKKFRGVSDKNDIEKEAPDAEVAKARKMLEIYRELKKEISATKNNPLMKNFFEAIFTQIKLTEEELRKKVNPNTFAPTFIKQVELLHAIKGKADPSQQEKDLLSYFEEKFSKEPRFSYLMNPLIASFVKTAIDTGVRNPELRPIMAAGLKDFERYYLRKKVGQEFYGPSPTELASKMVYNLKNQEIEILNPEPFRKIDETIQKRISEINQLEGKEHRSKVQELGQSIRGALVSLDTIKYGPSPQMHGLRQSLVRGLTLLPGETKEAVQKFEQLSATEPHKLENDSNLLVQLAKRAGLSLSSEALGRFSNYDPVLKRVLSGVLTRIPSFGEKQKAELSRILQSGSSTDIMHALMMPIKGFHQAVTEELAVMGADKEAIMLLRELSNYELMNSRQGQEYSQLRARIKKEILAEGFNATSFQKLNETQKANLFVLALLDEHGLQGVTPRDEVPPSNPDHYNLGALYNALNNEEEYLKALSKESGKSQEVLDREMMQHITSVSGKSTGLPPKTRQTILDRLNNRPSSHQNQFSVPGDIQIDLLKFAARVAARSSGNSQSEKLAQGNLQKLLMLPLTQKAMDNFIADHSGPESMSFYRPAEQYVNQKEGLDSLFKQGFFDRDKFRENVERYGAYSERITQERKKLAEGILDFARAKLNSEISKMNRESAPDPKKSAQIESLKSFIENYLGPAVSDGAKLALIEQLANDLLGNPSLFESQMVALFPGANPEVIQGLIRSSVELLKANGIKDHLMEKLSAPVEKLKIETRNWRDLFDREFKDLPDEHKVLAEQTLADFQSYRKALTENYQASFRNPGDSVPESWVTNTKQFFREFENIPTLMKNFQEGSEAHKKVTEALANAASDIEKKAEKEGRDLQETQKSVIAEITDRTIEGAFKHNDVSYDPALNRIVIGNDSFIDQKLVDKLSKLKNYNLFIESEGQVIAFDGQQGLNDWIREQRFKYGYSHDSDKQKNGEFIRKGELYLPLNERTAVKVFREGDGTYKYEFEDAKKIKGELEENKQKLVEDRKAYLEAQKDFKGVWHASKSYFGNVGNWGLWNSTTDEEKRLNSTYNELMIAVGKVGEAGHVQDDNGLSGKGRSELNRDQIKNQLLPAEMAAINGFLSKAETIHELTVLLVSLPAANLVAARLAVAANSIKGTTVASRALARSLLTTAKAAKAYSTATKAALGTARTFTIYGTGIEVGATALEAWWGDGPKMIRAKEDLFNQGKPWRKYADGPPFEGDFKGNTEAYHKALAEYEIEEAMDPDRNGKPNDHDFSGLNITLNGRQTGADLLWSPVEQFAGNAKFFQALNIAKALPGVARLGLPGEMAFAPLWTKFNPFFDPGLQKVKREEQSRREFQEKQTKKPEIERTLIEIAGREMGMGAVEGFRFGASGIPTKMLTGALPKNSLSLALGTLAFIATDEASKYAINSTMGGKLRNPFANPDWKKEMAHSFVIGGYIGYGMAKGGQQSAYYRSLKDKIGISDKPSERKVQEKSSAVENISELVAKDFHGDEGQALLFLRTLTAQEIDSAPLHIQTEFFRLMKKQGEKAVEQVNKFVQDTGRGDLKIEAEKLAKVIPELTSLEHLTKTRILTAQEGAKLQELRLTQDLALFNLQQAIEPLKTAADKARTRMEYLTKNLEPLTPQQRKQYETDQEIVKKYAENGARIHDAIIRMDTVKNFQGPVLLRTSVLEPASQLAGQMLKNYPEAQQALNADLKKRADNPTAWEGILKTWKYLEDGHIAPNFSRGGTWWHGPQGFDGQNRMASITIQSVRKDSKSSEVRDQLLDILRIIDPKTAVNIERQEAKDKRPN